MAGAEEDAVPLHLNTVKFYSDHALTSLSQCLSQFLCAQVFVDSQRMGEQERAGFTVTNQ